MWSPTALEVLARYSSNPEAVLTGRLVPEQWIEFKRELLLLRLALTAERVLTLFELDQDDALRPLKVEVLNPIELRITCSDEISLACEYGQRFKALPGVPIVVRLCPYEQHGYERVWSELDWSNDDNHPILLACTKDLDWAGPVCWLGLSSKAESRLSVLKLIDTLDELDGEILVRLKRAATTRVGLEGRGE
ncbi:MAG: hypothetical protein K1X83_09085 [Oligoflexia bacterium]|nr:hypothetical protein [Oligoflexia bacterium]